MTYLIDRRLQGKNKSAVNRERFLRRYKAQIKDAVGRAIKSEAVVSSFRAQGIEPLQGGPAAFSKFIADDTARWAEVVAKSGLAKQ